jgi:hypothetical protein
MTDVKLISVNMGEITWMVDPIQTYTMKIKMQKIPSYAEALNRNMTNIYYQFLDYKVAAHENISLEWKGVQRSGKTTGAISTHKYISMRTGVPFKVENVLSNEQYYTEAVRYAKFNDGFIVDEQKEQQTGLGSFRMMQHTEDITNITAKLCLHTSWIHPPEFVGRGGFYGLETSGRDFVHKLTKFLLYDLTQKTYGASSIPLGFIIIPKYNDPAFEKKYEAKKDIGIDSVRNEDIAVIQKQRLDEGFALAKNKLFQRLKNNFQKLSLVRNIYPMRTEGEAAELVSIANMNLKLNINQKDFDDAKKDVDKTLEKIKSSRR